MGCLINYLISLSTLLKVPETPGSACAAAGGALAGSILSVVPAEASGFRGCGRRNVRGYIGTSAVTRGETGQGPFKARYSSVAGKHRHHARRGALTMRIIRLKFWCAAPGSRGPGNTAQTPTFYSALPRARPRLLSVRCMTRDCRRADSHPRPVRPGLLHPPTARRKNTRFCRAPPRFPAELKA